MRRVVRFYGAARWLAALCASCLALLSISAHASPAFVFDAGDGSVLYAEDADRAWYPASLTKLMTAYVIFGMLKRGEFTPDSEFVISPRANLQPKSRLGLGAGKHITIHDALYALIIYSANDIAMALAEATAGSEDEFVEEMNRTALKLGMLHTRFANANGLPKDGQATTARDMALLARAIIKQYPEWLPVFATHIAQVASREIHTHNYLLEHFEGADGMKTGFTCGAGYNIVASATRNGRKLVAVVLGERSKGDRSTRTMKLLEAGFAAAPGQAIERVTDPEPRDEQNLLQALTFVPAEDFSLKKSINNCFPPTGPTPALVKDIAAHKNDAPKPAGKKAEHKTKTAKK